jgi:hypothetical protein
MEEIAMGKVKDYKFDNGEKHLFGVLEKESNTIAHFYEIPNVIPLSMNCFMRDFFKKDSTHKIVKLHVTSVETLSQEEAMQ